MKKKIIFTITALLLTAGFGFGQQTKRNLVANSCFEEGLKHWYASCYSTCKVLYSADTDEPISGTASALVYVDKSGGKTYDAMLYTLFPVERKARYKISFKVKCSQNTRLKLELCADHDSYTSPVLVSQPASFRSETSDRRMLGTIDVATESQEYTFITQEMDNADWRYKLGFHFGNAPRFALFWIDDVKICRADEGEWDGNLFPGGDFEDTKIYLNDDFLVQNTTDGNTSSQISSLKPLDGKKSYRLKGTSFDASVPFCPNEDASYDLEFTMQCGNKAEILNSVLPDFDQHFTIAFGTGAESERVQCKFHRARLPEVSASHHTIERFERWNFSFSNLLELTEKFELRMDNFRITENNLQLRDFEIIDPVTELEMGKSCQLKVGEFVTPTHADPTVLFSVENGKGSATIDQTGLLTGVSAGDVIVKASTPSGEVMKKMSVNIIYPSSIAENRISGVTLSPTVVSKGEKVYLAGVAPDAEIQVYASDGRFVGGKGTNCPEIETGYLGEGMYMVRIVQNREITLCKFLVK